jgi:outer membrane protein TolC
MLAPRWLPLPEKLHWSFWESYSTWLTGFALFTVLYLFNARSFLIDKNVFDWSPAAAITTSLAFLAAFWLIYDAICRLFGQRRRGDLIVGVGVAFPLPLWRPRTANIAAAEAKRQQAVAVLAVARREVERRVVSAARGYDSRLAELAHWRSDVVSQFESAAELADRHYRLGAVPATTYIELQKQYLDAVEAHLDTRREALAALLELEQATGLSLVSAPNTQPARP